VIILLTVSWWDSLDVNLRLAGETALCFEALMN